MKRLAFTIVVSAAIVTAGATVVLMAPTTASTHHSAGGTGVQSALPLEYFFPEQFSKTLTHAEQLTRSFPGTMVRGGVIPHDLLRGEYIAHFFSELSGQQPATVVLIGPNHFERGPGHVLTAAESWDTPDGILKADTATITRLTELQFVEQDAAILQHEHSIAGIVPYIAHYLPGTKLIPIILKAESTLMELNDLSDFLASALPPDAVVIASVDFSHYLTAAEAEQHDAITGSALSNLNYSTILSFGSRFNDYLDSPPSIALLLKYLEATGVKNCEILYNTNSGGAIGNTGIPVTSYFEVIYY
ncbi:MAG: AmmeMemoRadiSam system protein B [Patescibacteria group bacterium]